MLIFSDAKITILGLNNVRVEGLWQPYEIRIRQFFAECGLVAGNIRRRRGKFLFSSHIDPALHQRIRNFLVNECPCHKRR